jgi:hypothetical protein
LVVPWGCEWPSRSHVSHTSTLFHLPLLRAGERRPWLDCLCCGCRYVVEWSCQQATTSPVTRCDCHVPSHLAMIWSLLRALFSLIVSSCVVCVGSAFPTRFSSRLLVFATLRRVWLALCSRVAVGPVGLACAVGCQLLGAACVIVGDMIPSRLKQARCRKGGADCVYAHMPRCILYPVCALRVFPYPRHFAQPGLELAHKRAPRSPLTRSLPVACTSCLPVCLSILRPRPSPSAA